MHVCGGDGCARGHYFGRGLLAGATHAQAPEPSLIDAQRLQLELVLAAITIMVFVASVSYIALSTIFSCFYTGRSQQQPGNSEMWSQAQRSVPAVVEETKRALEEIPVVMVQVTRDSNSGSGGVGAVEDDDEPRECAVCLAEYAGGEEVRVLPTCRHGFHRECVDRWLLTRAPTCPVCRALITPHAEGPDAKV
ncbi:hypothetical protein BDA96_02G292200 [Sorghum bicolor]|uniref:RING-type domain-containing protein n=2 Tax=Sorghum bicolor TaxID=4558 RepID=C5X6U1_SORBI|nr:probable E3 ubiquitin-protein ligase ATL44 [Sorghum bicolor]EER99258.1 hypothetical protein SORBI_3002G277800 [Sorghum bicolor]KAG0544625.1 hypothetical protein BDA96_02G292200 [Sorghum bicolor]|eukprot:XP_002462737.1 probable E3 ubiquitin-protein ligase ATL44 [Sorghum bicolor]